MGALLLAYLIYFYQVSWDFFDDTLLDFFPFAQACTASALATRANTANAEEDT